MPKVSHKEKNKLMQDLSQWNFVLFLTLAMMLIYGIVAAVNTSNNDVRTRAEEAREQIIIEPANGILEPPEE